ncbi:MAG: folate-binding protein [Gallionella sp.]|nr:folate-binding protein [Gallionella sp.]
MATDWQNFLIQHGAIIKGGVAQHFGNPAAELNATAQSTVLCDLGQFGTLRVSGVEAQQFLQNLLSNDIREAGAAGAQLGSLNSPRGRILATMLIWRDGDDYLLQLPQTLCEPIRKKLGMYVLRAKVKITDASDEIVSLGLSGADTQEILRARFGELPQEKLTLTVRPEFVEGDGSFSEKASTGSARTDILAGSVLKISDTRWQINATPPQAQMLWAELSRHALPVGSVYWDWLNIRSVIPVILPQTQEQFVPQMVNLDLIGGVSFKKGCYPGQEIVARMQYLGKLKRRMYLAHLDTLAQIDSNETPQPGDELFSADMEGQASGMLVNTAPSPSGGYDVLAVVQTSSHETQTVHWKSLQGAALQFLPLPYTLPL